MIRLYKSGQRKEVDHRCSKKQTQHADNEDQQNNQQEYPLNVPRDWPIEQGGDPGNNGAAEHKNCGQENTIQRTDNDTSDGHDAIPSRRFLARTLANLASTSLYVRMVGDAEFRSV